MMVQINSLNVGDQFMRGKKVFSVIEITDIVYICKSDNEIMTFSVNTWVDVKVKSDYSRSIVFWLYISIIALITLAAILISEQ